MQSNISKKKDWRNTYWIPDHNEGSWSYIKNNKVSDCESKQEINSILRNWTLTSNILIAAPEDRKFQVPVFAKEFQNGLQKRITLQFKFTFFAMIILYVCVILFTIQKQPNNSLEIIIFSSVIFGLMSLDMINLIKNNKSLQERSLYLHWILHSKVPKNYSRSIILFSVGLACLQLILQNTYGGFDAVIKKFGAYYPALDNRDYWRFITGPYLHSSAAHFINNFLMLLLIGTVAMVRSSHRAICAFVVANFFAVVGVYYLHSEYFDAYAGISPGVNALFSLMILDALNNRKDFPIGFAPNMVTILLLSNAIVFTHKNISGLSHVIGLISGLLIYHAPSLRFRISDKI